MSGSSSAANLSRAGLFAIRVVREGTDWRVAERRVSWIECFPDVVNLCLPDAFFSEFSKMSAGDRQAWLGRFENLARQAAVIADNS